MGDIIGGDFNNAAADWTAAIGGTGTSAGLQESELETFLGVASNSITAFAPETAAGTSWTFTLEGVDFKIASDGKLFFKNQYGSWSDINAGGTGGKVNIADGLTTNEIAAFNRIANQEQILDTGTINDSTNINGRTVGFAHKPGSMFEKMLYGIASQMNEMFLDILSMSTVLSNGTGLRGILLLAEKGITIDGVSIANMIKGPNGEPIDDLTALGAMFDRSPSIGSVSGPGGVITEAGDYDSVTVNIDGEDVTLDLSDSDGLTFVVTPPGEGNEWSMDNIDVKLTNSDSILESPGTLFLIQQLLQQMKDAMQAIGAVGKVGGDVKTTAVQSFVRDMNG